MIQPSPTAHHATNLKVVEGSDGREAERKRLYRKSRKNPPRCLECNAKVTYLKSKDRHILCERHAHLYAGLEEARNSERARKGGASGSHGPQVHPVPNLYELREERGFTRESLSRASGVGTRAIRNAEKGRTGGLQERTRRLVAQALGVEVSEL